MNISRSLGHSLAGAVGASDTGRHPRGEVRHGFETLPLYVASLIVSLCGVGAASVTLTDTAWMQRCVVLTVAGHVTSYFLRRMRLGYRVVYWLVAILAGVILVYESTRGQMELGVAASTLPPDMRIAVLISWLVVIRSFSLVTNGSLLFSCVPALATLGLTASANSNLEISILFGVFVFGTIFMAVYEQHLRRIALSGEQVTLLTWNLSTSAVIFLVTLATGSLVGLAGAKVFSPLSPYALPALTQIQANAPSFMTGPEQNGGPILVGNGPIDLPPTPVFDIYCSEPGLVRNGVLEDYDGRGWFPARARQLSLESAQRATLSHPEDLPSSERPPGTLYRFPLEPSPYARQPYPVRRVRQVVVAKMQLSPQLPVLERAVEVRYPEQMLFFSNRDGVVSGRTYFRPGTSFEVISEVPEIPPAALRQAPSSYSARTLVSQSCLALPATALRLEGLAEQITTGKKNDYDKVQAIIRYIEANCSYSLLEQPTPTGEDAVEYYLFTTKVGACDLATSAAVMLCRAAGIPARAVTGYVMDQPVSNEPGGFDGFQVRQMDAHMWLEVFFPGYGWVEFNPSPPSRDLTPSPWDAAVSQIRHSLLSVVRGSIDTYLALIVALFLFVTLARAFLAWGARLWRGWRRERMVLAAGGAPALGVVYRRMDRTLGRAGWRRDPAMTPDEYRRWVATEWGAENPATGLVGRITDLFVRACYADDVAPAAVAEARRDLDGLRRAIPRRRRRGAQ